MNLRLGYLVPEFPSQTHVFFWREIQALRRLGAQVFPLSTRKPSPMICRHEFATTAVSETHYIFPPAVADLFAWRIMAGGNLGRAIKYLNELEPVGFKNSLRRYALVTSAVDLVSWARRQNIDHVHAQSCADAAHVLAMARLMGGPPYSVTLHGDLEVYGADQRSKMREAAFVCVVGNHLRRQVIERVGINADRILVTSMGLDTAELASFGQNRSYTPGTLHIATVARLHAAKGHLHALAAMHAGLQSGLNLHYTIAGEGPFRDAINLRVQELGLEGRVTVTGTLSEIEVFELLSKVDTFLLPSTGLGEAWPVSVMEAMSAGLPVIASEIGATPEMITPGKDGFLVHQGDEQAILEKISLLAHNVDVRRRIGEAGRRTAQERFDIAGTVNKLRDTIERSLGPGHR